MSQTSDPPAFTARILLLAVLSGALFTLMINLPSFAAMQRGVFSLATLGVEVRGSADETYYAALIRDVAEGYSTIGNVSLFEHRDAQSVIGYAPLFQGFLMRLFRLSLETSMFVGDVLFPFFAGFVTFLLMRRMERQTVAALFGAAAILAWKGSGWLRSFSPQITGVLFLCGLLAMLLDGRWWMLLRGIAIGFLLLSQPIFAAFLLLAEGLLGCRDWKERGFRAAFRAHLPVVIPVTIVVLVRLALAAHDPEPLLLADTYRRLGLIPSHLPAAPRLQLAVIAIFFFHFWAARRTHAASKLDRSTIPLILMSALLSLWLSFFIGVDGIFGLYFTFPFQCILWLVFFRSLALVLPVSFRILFSGCIAVAFLYSAYTTTASPFRAQESPTVFDMQTLLSSIDTDVPGRIVAAPLEISNFVPVFTPHYALFTHYARYQYASDQELAERYLALHALFPFDSLYTLEGHPLVFGLYAGNLSARTRTWCKMLVATKLSEGPCDQTLSDFIYHQDVRQFVERGKIDVFSMLQKYGVNTIITENPLPPDIAPFCTLAMQAQTYGIYDCAFSR